MIRYYHCTFRQTSPLRLSNGESEETDSDLMLDLQGFPFIPGSALAGVLRSMLEEEDAKDLFGSFSKGNRTESRIVVSDAVLPDDILPEDILIISRDGVGLNERGTARKTAKYNFQVVETDKPYTALIELECTPGDHADSLLEALMKRIARDGISLGARTTRGYGRTSVTVKSFHFDLNTEESLKEWLHFDPVSGKIPNSARVVDISADTSAVNNTTLCISANLIFDGPFSVRVYSTESVPESEKKTVSVPDYSPLKNRNGAPVVPGTSWAGVFRHHIQSLGLSAGLDKGTLGSLNAAFGYSDEEKVKSRIVFEETSVNGGSEKILKRNAIDRFTSAPRRGALYCAALWNGGTGALNIRIDSYDKAKDHLLVSLIILTLRDLNLGLLNVGGEGGAGRGRVKISRLTVGSMDYSYLMEQDHYALSMEGF